MSGFVQDLRFGLRLLARSPVFAMTGAALLAVGISACTLIFTLVDALLLRDLPVARPGELVRLVEDHPTGFVTWDFPYGLCDVLAAKNSGFAEVLCQAGADVGLTEGGAAERVRTNLVPLTFFSSLGVGAELGRTLDPQDDRAETPPAVLSHEFFERRFRSDRAVLGRTIALRGHAFVVVGVTPRSFNGLSADTSPDIRVPLSADRWLVEEPEDRRRDRRGMNVQIFARLKPGVGLAAANAATEPLLRSAYDDLLLQLDPTLDRSTLTRLATRIRVESVRHGVSTLRQQFSVGLRVLMAGVVLLLLMACTDVAGLLVARSTVRASEITVRLAVGARRGRVIRQLLTENVLLAALGAAGGVALTYACIPLLLSALPPIRDRAAVVQPLAVHIGVDLRILGFAVGVAFLSAIVSGLSPALQCARTNLAGSLRGARTTRGRTAQRVFVSLQVGLCTVLLAGAAVLVRTLDRMRSMDPGFDRDHVVTFTVDPRLRGYKANEARLLASRLVERVRSLPGVAAASVASRAVMRGTGIKNTVQAAGRPVGRDDFLNASLNSVMPGYFETMGMRLLAGRDFNGAENGKQKPAPVIVNEALARRFFPGKDPVGKLFGPAGKDGIATPGFEIAGVVSDARYRSLREPVPPTTYTPLIDFFDFGFVLHVRTGVRPETMVRPVREALQSLDPQLPFVETATLLQEVESSLWQERLLAVLSAVFGGVAALLASIGLYGALDYAVKARTREIGVRIALGANPARIARLLAGEGAIVVFTGLCLGAGAYAAAARWIRQVLYEVPPSDARALGAVLLLVILISAAAATPSACRAAGLRPANALRQE